MNEMEKIFAESKTIAVVGLSSNPARPSYSVARYLQSQGYKSQTNYSQGNLTG